MSTATTIRFSEDEKAAIKTYAERQRRSFSDVVRHAILDRIEDEYDLRELRTAVAEHEKDLVTISHAEIMKEFGLDGK
jgi:predicted transcriptional regulator